MNGIGWKFGTVAALACVLLVTGCNENSDAPRAVRDLSIRANQDSEREIASRVHDYMLRNCPGIEEKGPEMQKHWPPAHRQRKREEFAALRTVCVNVRSIGVNGKKIIIRGDYAGKMTSLVGTAFCNIILGTNATGNTPGNRLVDLEGRTLDSCRAFNFSP